MNFRNPSGARYLKGLFFEETNSDKSTVLYTLKDQDHKGYPSLYRLYMETGDPTEYRFAVAHLDGWEHWEMLTECEWFKPIVARWRRELELKVRSQALASILETAAGSSMSAYQANKFLLEGGWKEANPRGRPSKEKIKAEARTLVEGQKHELNDLERIKLFQ